jgi:hypothetical protein
MPLLALRAGPLGHGYLRRKILAARSVASGVHD